MKKRLLIWCDTPTAKTGFGVVAKHLFEELHQHFDVAILGINYYGLQRYDQSKYFIYSVDRMDMMGFERMNHVLNDFKPNIVLLFQDIFNIDYAIPVIKKYNKDIPIITYFPIDARPVNKAWGGALMAADKLITYTQWGIEGLLQSHPSLKDRKIDYLYHGVDTIAFKPLSQGLIKKFKEEKGWDNKFLVLSVNRFQPRKMLMMVFRAHALFTKGYKECKCGNVYLHSMERCDLNNCGPENVVQEVPGRTDSMLYIHSNTEERMMGPGRSNLLQSHLINAGFVDSDVNKTVAVYGGNVYENPLTDAELNIIYNVADVNVSTTLGEGVGLSLIESAACGTTSIAPNHSSIPEMLGDTGHIVPNSTLINIALDNGHLRPVISMKHYLVALETEYQKWIANGRKKIINKEAIDRVHKLFMWQDKRDALLGWLKQYA